MIHFSEILPNILHASGPLFQWLNQYGQFAIVILLALGIIGLPIPDETLIAVSGAMVAKGDWGLVITFLAVFSGAMIGISVSYLIGATIGHYLVKHYGKWIGFTEQRVARAHHWFERIGKWALVIGYFIPGVRHLTGYVAGTLELPFREFALFAYFGALLWTIIFFTLGYFFQLSILNTILI